MNEEEAAGSTRSGKESEQKQPTNGKAAQAKGEDAIAMLKSDHRKVEQLFQQFEQAARRSEKQKVAQQICRELIVHTMLEEQIFYPACREHVDDSMLDEAQVEHDGAKVLINELLSGSPDQAFYDAKVKVLSEEIKHHVNEEEKRDGIFAKAKASGLDAEALGQQLAARKAELMQQIEQIGLERPRPRSFTQARMERDMPQGQYRDRDDRGRFMSDEDDRRSYSSSSRSRGGYSRYDDDDRRSRSRERDEYGRFMSDDDDDRRYSSRSREDDDDRRGRGRGGWFGDSEGHAQAARQRSGGGRFEDDGRRGGGRGRGGWFGDAEGHSQASREGWRNSDHEGSGWYGDPEGHSQASREGWRSSDHEGSGWYGDPEGHSEASRRGWEERGGSRGRSRYEEDDRRYSSRGRGRGQGGWFGDPEGHSEASRRGWENR